jgi:predicted amidohydrolase YtcJ
MATGSRRLVFLRNGNVFDGRRHRPGVAVVVADDRILAVGPDAELASSVLPAGGADVEEVDLEGGLLLPGFQDAHVHPVQGGLERLRCDLSELESRDGYLSEVKRYAAAHPQLSWVVGSGWALSVFGPAGPTADELSAVVADRPVVLLNRDHHGAWVNHRALELAGVDETTPDPDAGRLERDAEGRPTGMLHEGAMTLVTRHVPATSAEEYYRGLLEGQAYLHTCGITGWQDAILGDYAGGADPSPAYLRAAECGDLTARVRGALWWDRERGAEQVADLVERRSRYTHGRLVAGSVKVMQDGIAENFTAAMTTPYLDGHGRPTGNAGLSFVDPRALREHVTRLDAEGFQVHFHAIGDRAVREALDSFEAAQRSNGASSSRHHIAHLQVIHPDDVDRFARLGVVANMQPLWAQLDDQMTDMTIPFLGPERARWQYSFASLAEAGARLAGGSDWPVSSPDPLQGIHVAVNRWGYGEPGRAGSEPFLPEQRLSLEQAFTSYTSGSAFVNHHDETGVLEPGRLADLAVLDRDPFLGGLDEVGAARAVRTYVGGVQVHGPGA